MLAPTLAPREWRTAPHRKGPRCPRPPDPHPRPELLARPSFVPGRSCSWVLGHMPPALPPTPVHGQHPAALAPLKVPSARLSTHSPEPTFTLLRPPFPTHCLLSCHPMFSPRTCHHHPSCSPGTALGLLPTSLGALMLPDQPPAPIPEAHSTYGPGQAHGFPGPYVSLAQPCPPPRPGPLCLSSPAMPPAQTSAPTTCPSRALTRPRLSSPCCVFSPHLRRRGHQPSVSQQL